MLSSPETKRETDFGIPAVKNKNQILKSVTKFPIKNSNVSIWNFQIFKKFGIQTQGCHSVNGIRGLSIIQIYWETFLENILKSF